MADYNKATLLSLHTERTKEKKNNNNNNNINYNKATLYPITIILQHLCEHAF